MQRHQQEFGSNSGFTMIELLLVILVLGILAATVIFDLGNTTGSAASAACNSDAKTVETAVMGFKYNPANTAFAWPQASPAGNTQLTDSAAAGYGGPFLNSWPSSSHYTITIDANGNVFVNGQQYGVSPNPCTNVS